MKTPQVELFVSGRIVYIGDDLDVEIEFHVTEAQAQSTKNSYKKFTPDQETLENWLYCDDLEYEMDDICPHNEKESHFNDDDVYDKILQAQKDEVIAKGLLPEVICNYLNDGQGWSNDDYWFEAANTLGDDLVEG